MSASRQPDSYDGPHSNLYVTMTEWGGRGLGGWGAGGII